jgi:hypothetical protein
MHFLGVSDFLKCITLISCVLVYFDARFLDLIPESLFPLHFLPCSSFSSLGLSFLFISIV